MRKILFTALGATILIGGSHALNLWPSTIISLPITAKHQSPIDHGAPVFLGPAAAESQSVEVTPTDAPVAATPMLASSPVQRHTPEEWEAIRAQIARLLGGKLKSKSAATAPQVRTLEGLKVLQDLPIRIDIKALESDGKALELNGLKFLNDLPVNIDPKALESMMKAMATEIPAQAAAAEKYATQAQLMFEDAKDGKPFKGKITITSDGKTKTYEFDEKNSDEVLKKLHDEFPNVRIMHSLPLGIISPTLPRGAVLRGQELRGLTTRPGVARTLSPDEIKKMQEMAEKMRKEAKAMRVQSEELGRKAARIGTHFYFSDGEKLNAEGLDKILKSFDQMHFAFPQLSKGDIDEAIKDVHESLKELIGKQLTAEQAAKIEAKVRQLLESGGKSVPPKVVPTSSATSLTA